MQKGFTIIELLIAMAFFSFVLMLVFTGFIQINRSYNRGITVKNVQNSARAITEDIVKSMRNTSSVDGYSQDPYRLCLGNARYSWNQFNGTSFTTEPFVGSEFLDPTATGDYAMRMVRDENNNCYDGVFAGRHNATDLLSENQIVQYIGIEQIPNTKTYNLTVVVSSSETSDFATFGENASCRVQVGDEWCAIAKIETSVTIRN